MPLPCTQREIRQLGWDAPDVILVSGDAYIDSPYSGVAVIGRVLEREGFRTAILSQPDPASTEAFRSLGEPRLFWGVTSGCVDSMVANTPPPAAAADRMTSLPAASTTPGPTAR